MVAEQNGVNRGEGENLRFLSAGVDTLHASLYLDVFGRHWEALEHLTATRAELHGKARRAPLPYSIGGVSHDFAGSASRTGYAYRLECPSWTLLLAPRLSEADAAAPAFVELSSEFLWSWDTPRAAWEAFVERVVPELGRWTDGPKLSRVDLCCDWEGWRPRREDQAGFVRRSRWSVANSVKVLPRAVRRKGALHKVAYLLECDADAERWREGLRDVLSEAEREAYERSYGWGDDFTGWQFGKGKLAARLYDKTREIADESPHKAWFADVWGREHFDAGAPVWRLEFQVRREPLKQFGLDDPAHALTPVMMRRLWRYCVGGRFVDPVQAQMEELGQVPEAVEEDAGGWLSLRAPEPGVRRSRWPIRPEWRALQDVPFGAGGSPLVRDTQHRASLERALGDGLRAMARAVIWDAAAPDDAKESPDAAARWLLESGAWKRYLKEQPGLGWDGLLEGYARRVPPDLSRHAATSDRH